MTKNDHRVTLIAFAIIFMQLLVAEVNAKPSSRHLGHTLAIAARQMADNQTGSASERENSVLKAANKIMDELEAENEANREKDPAAFDYIKKRYEKIRSELPNRIHRMYYRRGLLNKAARCLEGVIELVKGEVRHKIKMVLKPVPIGGKCKEAIARFGSEFMVEGHRSVKNYRVLKRSLQETDKVVKAEVGFFKDLSKKMHNMPKRETAEKVKQLSEKCLEACLKIKAECTRKNCKDKGYSGCAEDCGTCASLTCGFTFNEYWGSLEPGNLGCAGGVLAAYLGSVEGCANNFASSKEDLFKRKDSQTTCLKKVYEVFEKGILDCRNQSCKNHCNGPYKLGAFAAQCYCNKQ